MLPSVIVWCSEVGFGFPKGWKFANRLSFPPPCTEQINPKVDSKDTCVCNVMFTVSLWNWTKTEKHKFRWLLP